MFELTYVPTFIYENGDVETSCETIRRETFDTLEERTARREEIKEKNNNSLQNDRKNVTVVYSNMKCNIIE